MTNAVAVVVALQTKSVARSVLEWVAAISRPSVAEMAAAVLAMFVVETSVVLLILLAVRMVTIVVRMANVATEVVAIKGHAATELAALQEPFVVIMLVRLLEPSVATACITVILK